MFDYSRDGVRRSLAESLERLQLGRVDIALLHDPDRHVDEARRSIDAVRELAAHVGVGTNDVETALAFVAAGEVDVVLLAGRYTLLDRSAERELLPVCAERGVPVIAAGVFNSGVLAGGATFDYEPAPAVILKRRDALEAACARYAVPLAAAAISSRSGIRRSDRSSSAPVQRARSKPTHDSSQTPFRTSSGQSSTPLS